MYTNVNMVTICSCSLRTQQRASFSSEKLHLKHVQRSTIDVVNSEQHMKILLVDILQTLLSFLSTAVDDKISHIYQFFLLYS